MESSTDTTRPGEDAPKLRLMIAGAPKSGSTSLLRYLEQHPGVTAHAQPEMSYFLLDHEYDLGYPQALGKYYPDADTGGCLIAKHVHVMYSEQACARLREHNPDLHVAVLLRDPARRAYSAYWYCRRRGWESIKTFGAALDAEPKRLEAGWFEHRANAYLYNGVYAPHIQRLHDTFGPGRVHVMLTEDLKADPAKACAGLFSAIGLDTGFTPDAVSRHNTSAAARSETLARVMARGFKTSGPIKRALRKCLPHGVTRRLRKAAMNLNERPFEAPPMDQTVRHRLVDYFTPHNEALGRLIGRDLSAWSEVDG